MKTMEEFIQRELELYNFRNIENTDMELKIKELELRDQIAPISYEERVQVSVKCKNNDTIMNLISSYKNKIEINKLSNQRVDNILSILEEEEEEVIRNIYIYKKSKTKVAQEMNRSRKGINGLLRKASEKISDVNERMNDVKFEKETLRLH